jgi:acetyl-CoA carboxylase beta subunit
MAAAQGNHRNEKQVNHRFDSKAVNTVFRAHLEQGYSICLMGCVFVRMPKRKNISMLLEPGKFRVNAPNDNMSMCN